MSRASITFSIERTEPQDGIVRFSGVAYSGGMVPAYGALGDIAIDIDTIQNIGARVPVLADHDARIEAIVGHGAIERVDGADGVSLRIVGEVSEATPAGAIVAELLRGGTPIQMSVGLTGKLEKTGGREVEVNGRAMRLDAVFRDALIREVSFVPVGADPETGAAIFSIEGGETMHKEDKAADTAELESVRAELEAARKRIEELETELKAVRDARRKSELSALFKAIGRDEPESWEAYLAMDDAAFGVLVSELKAVADQRRQADAALFSQQAEPVTHSHESALFSAVAALTK